jgi:hypothetical protein
MAAYVDRWLPNPFCTLSFGIGKSRNRSLTFSTHSTRKCIKNVNITQTSKTTIKFEIDLIYYPGTFSAGNPNLLEYGLHTAMSNQETRWIFLQFGYMSGSPYSGTSQQSPIYRGLITNVQTTVGENSVSYKVTGYGVDIALGNFLAVDTNIDKIIRKDTKADKFLRTVLLNDGKFVINGIAYNFKIVIQNGLNLNMNIYNMLVGYSMQSLNITEQYIGRPANMGVDTAALQAALKAASDATWNKVKYKLHFDSVKNENSEKSHLTNVNSMSVEEIDSKNQYSVFEAVELFSRILNSSVKDKKYNLKCIVEPFTNGYDSYDGTITIFDAGQPTSSKKTFFWGKWSNLAGYASNRNPVISWSCSYNATAMLFKGSSSASNLEEAQKLYANVNTDLEQSMQATGEITFNLVDNQTASVSETDYRSTVAQNIQFTSQLRVMQQVFDYPYKAVITVLGIPEPYQIARDRITVNVFVNGSPHHTTGEYMILGYSHSINSSGQFTTTYDLLKIPNRIASNESKIESFANEIENKKSIDELMTGYFSSK